MILPTQGKDFLRRCCTYFGIGGALILELTGVNKSTIWRWVKEKSDFPKPKKISKGVTVWNYWEVDLWVNQSANNK